MADRNVYGRDFSENGWRMVDTGSCVWVKVPGTNVSLQIREGQPAKILGAWAADISAYVEPLRDADSACWTPTNSVASSNHLSGTALDLNWDSHPFKVKDAGYNAAQIKTIREMLAYYEKLVWWGNDWDSPKDAMHYQMGYDTYGSENVDRVQKWIDTHIREDGFSTFRRGGVVAPPVVAPPVSEGNRAATVLAKAAGITAGKAADILSGVVDGLRASQCNNVNRVAMWLAQMGHESGGFNYTEEIASGAAYEGRADLGNTQQGDGVRFKGRSWIQVTGRSNYTKLSKWAFDQGIVASATFFVDAPTKLAQNQFAGLGPAWYWTVARPQLNSLSDKRDLVAVTQAINGGQNGIADRRQRYDRALALGNDLLVLVSNDVPAQGEDELSVEDSRKIDVIYQELTKKFVSRSRLRSLDSGPLDTMAGFVLNTDGNQHVEFVRALATYNHPETMALLTSLAKADPGKYPDRVDDIRLAQAILAENKPASAAPVTSFAAVAEPAPTTAPTYTLYPPAAVNNTAGQVIGQAYDALQALLATNALGDGEKSTLTALINVLQTKSEAAE